MLQIADLAVGARNSAAENAAVILNAAPTPTRNDVKRFGADA
jgi:hypothetical protein